MFDLPERYLTETFDSQGRLVSCTYHFPDNFNYGYDVLDVIAREYPDRLAMLWRNDRGAEKRLTFGQVAALSNRTANLFRSRGLKKGDVLLTVLRCHWEYWVAALAAHKLGLILAPVYWRLTEEDLAYRMKKAGAKAVLTCTDGETSAHVAAAADQSGVAVRFALTPESGFEDFHALLNTQPEVLDRAETEAHEPILLYFTSGTSGAPKGVLHDHRYPLANHFGARYMQDIHPGSLHFATGDTGWEIVSGTKFYGQWMNLGALLVLDYDRFSARMSLELLAETRATGVMAQPTVYRQWTDLGMDRFDLSAVTNYAIGGEKLPPDLPPVIAAQTGQPVYEGYAQSETNLVAANSKNMGRKAGSVGKVLPKYHVEILREDGTFALPGEQGEIVVVADGGMSPPGVTIGYLDDPEADAALWDGTLFHTGDLAVMDEDGFLFFRGRSDGMIKTKGYRVSPVELEDILSQHPAVYECLVCGQPDRDLGEKITAYVVPAPGYVPGAALAGELMDFHNARCAGFKKIRGLIFVERLARNANGKVLRGQFRDRAPSASEETAT